MLVTHWTGDSKIFRNSLIGNVQHVDAVDPLAAIA